MVVEGVDPGGGRADEEVRDAVAVRVQHLHGVAELGVGVGVVANLWPGIQNILAFISSGTYGVQGDLSPVLHTAYLFVLDSISDGVFSD